MKVYFYHTQDIQRIVREWGQGRFPGHFLYGATLLDRHGIDVVWHRTMRRYTLNRWRMIAYNTWQILTCRQHYDAIYATHYRGIELIIFMRALGLFRRPVVIWHHQPMIVSPSPIRRLLGRLFYRGIDHMFFFSEKLVNDSLATPNARPGRIHLGHWGPDMAFFNRLMTGQAGKERQGFISTGKERRDMTTLFNAFERAGVAVDVYWPETYRRMLDGMTIGHNVMMHYIDGLLPYELSIKVNGAACVVICCEETKYTVGLTTVVEALGLGLPMICSRNPQFPIDIDREGCGISVPYYDEDAWVEAIRYMASHPDEARSMGRRSRELAETRFNDEICAREAAEILRMAVNGQ